jgi:hypothetical protein
MSSLIESWPLVKLRLKSLEHKSHNHRPQNNLQSMVSGSS